MQLRGKKYCRFVLACPWKYFEYDIHRFIFSCFSMSFISYSIPRWLYFSILVIASFLPSRLVFGSALNRELKLFKRNHGAAFTQSSVAFFPSVDWWNISSQRKETKLLLPYVRLSSLLQQHADGWENRSIFSPSLVCVCQLLSRVPHAIQCYGQAQTLGPAAFSLPSAHGQARGERVGGKARPYLTGWWRNKHHLWRRGCFCPRSHWLVQPWQVIQSVLPEPDGSGNRC